MSDMSFMEKLLDGVEVEWKALWEVTIWDKRFNAVDNHKQPKIINYPYLLAAELFNLEQDNGDVFLLSTGEKTGWTIEELAGTYLREGEVVTIPWGKSRPVKDVIKYYKGRFVTADNRIATSNDIDKLLNKFLYYWMMSQANVIDRFYRGSGIQHPSMAAVLDMKIPIPCPDNPEKSLKIQTEIVRILDSFTELTTELTTELSARKKQYNYYRDQLLSFEEGEVEWKTLQEVALEFGRGKSKHRPRNDERLYGGDIPLIQTGDIRNAPHIITKYTQTYSKLGLEQSKLWQKGTLCITIAANIAETAILGFESCFPDSVIGFVSNPEKTSSGYVEYLLSSWKTKLQAKSTGSAQENINLATFKALLLPFPTIDEQNRIVSILNKFEALTNSISEGLPREIELRQKQYEYYRDLLLSFPKPEPEVMAGV